MFPSLGFSVLFLFWKCVFKIQVKSFWKLKNKNKKRSYCFWNLVRIQISALEWSENHNEEIGKKTIIQFQKPNSKQRNHYETNLNKFVCASLNKHWPVIIRLIISWMRKMEPQNSNTGCSTHLSSIKGVRRITIRRVSAIVIIRPKTMNFEVRTWFSSARITATSSCITKRTRPLQPKTKTH